MAYISSQMGPVLQVMILERMELLGEKRSRLKSEREEDSYYERSDITIFAL